MSLKIYYSPMSTASITTLILEELEVPCEWIRVDIKNGGTKTPEFAKINPNAKVPVLVHNGTPIWESAAITMYLGETFGVEKGLYPAAGPARGEAMKWIVWSNVTLGDAIGRFTRNTMNWYPVEQHNAKAGEAGKLDMHNCLKILDDGLADKEYLVGTFTLADAHVKSFTDWLRHMDFDFSAYPRVNAWAKRCSDRPASARAQAREA